MRDWSGYFLALIQSSQSAVTVFLTGEEASHGRSTEGAVPRGNTLVSITPVGQPYRMARNRIVQVDHLQPRSGLSH